MFGLTLVVDAVSEGDVEAVVAAALCSHLVHVACDTKQTWRRRAYHKPKLDGNFKRPLTRAGEEVVAVLVEGHGHDAVRQVKGLLDAVAVVNVDVDVQNPGVVPERQRRITKVDGETRAARPTGKKRIVLEKLQYADDDVIYVAEPRSLQTQQRRVRGPTRMDPDQKGMGKSVLTSNFLA